MSINIPLEALTSRLNLAGRFNSVRAQSLGSRFANLRPIGDFADLKRMSVPRDFAEAQTRLNFNLAHFSSNYTVLFLMLLIYSLLTNILLSFVIVLVVGGLWGISQLGGRDLNLGFVRATTSHLYTALLVLAVPLGFWAKPLSTLLWLVGATGVSIVGHAVLLDRPVDAHFSEEAHPRGAAGRPQGLRRLPRQYSQDWEPTYARERLFEELDDDEFDDDPRQQREEEEEVEDDWQQVALVDVDGFAARDLGARRARLQEFAGDELYFDGIDVGRDQDRALRRRPQRAYDYDRTGESYYNSEEEAYRQQRGAAYQLAVREKEEALIRSALERIARARALGRVNVNLSREEVEALERRNAGQLPPLVSLPLQPYAALALASPPPTPAKASPSKTPRGGSRSNSSTNLASQRLRSGSGKKSGSSPVKSNPKARVGDRNKTSSSSPSRHQREERLLGGVEGMSSHAPLVPYAGDSGGTTTRARSQSTRRGVEDASTDPEQQAYYNSSPRSYYAAPPGNMLDNLRSLPDEDDWYPPPPAAQGRTRAASYQVPLGYPGRVDEHGDHRALVQYPLAAQQQQQGRRVVSAPLQHQQPPPHESRGRFAQPSAASYSEPYHGSDGQRYATTSTAPAGLRRVPRLHHASSDPVATRMRSSGLGREVLRKETSSGSEDREDGAEDSGDDDEDEDEVEDGTEEGVTVNVSMVDAGGYAIQRAPLAATAPSNMAVAGLDGGRRKKSGRR